MARKPAGAPNRREKSTRADAPLTQVGNYLRERFGSWELVTARLNDELRNGNIYAVDQCIGAEGKVAEIELPRSFWSHAKVNAEYDVINAHAHSSFPVTAAFRALTVQSTDWPISGRHHVFLSWADVHHIWPHAAKEVATTQHRRRGPPPKDEWPITAAQHLLAIIAAADGKIPSNDTATAAEICQRIGDSREDGWQPPDSAMRAMVARLLTLARGNSG